jgi:ADP-heptose:LPS heptosyltransferase
VITEGDLGKLAALCAGSALVVSNDSGPRHLAVAVGAPTLAFFRQHHDREWNVYPSTHRCRILRGDAACPACTSGECIDSVPTGEQYGSHCMRMIETDHALAAIREMLSAS